MVKVLKAVSSAATSFLFVGIVLPFALDYFAPTLSSYISLPPSTERWEVFLLFGALLGVTAFLANGYSKGDFPWLFGKIGGNLADLGLFYYLFLLLPSSLGSAGIETSGLLLLVVLAIALSYGYTIFDFMDARRRKGNGQGGGGVPATVIS